MSEPYTRAAMVSLPAELVEALREAFNNHGDDPCPVYEAARALVDAAERPTAGEGEARNDKCETCGHGLSFLAGHSCGCP